MYNDKIKKTIYKWRESNKDKYNELMREHNKKYYDEHKEQRIKKNLDRYYFNKECQRFRNILL
jgi:FAD/FMN-containing dehydrogenase